MAPKIADRPPTPFHRSKTLSSEREAVLVPLLFGTKCTTTFTACPHGMVGLGLAKGGPLASAGLMGIGTAANLIANGSMQLAGDQPFDWTSFSLSGVTGALLTRMKFGPVFLTGVGGALTGSALQGQNPNSAMGARRSER